MQSQQSLNYERIARAIRFIREHRREQPCLEEVAEHVCMSPYHFQRMFREWAGTSPKQFLQYLNVEYAKRVLRETLARYMEGPVRQREVAANPESNVFACIRHMEAGNLSAVWKELGRSRHDPEGLFFPLLSLLARDVRLLWQCRMGENVRMHPSEAAFKQQLAARLGAAGLAELMSMIMDAEWQVKSGRRSVEQSLDMLAADVTDLCARAR